MIHVDTCRYIYDETSDCCLGLNGLAEPLLTQEVHSAAPLERGNDII